MFTRISFVFCSSERRRGVRMRVINTRLFSVCSNARAHVGLPEPAADRVLPAPTSLPYFHFGLFRFRCSISRRPRRSRRPPGSAQCPARRDTGQTSVAATIREPLPDFVPRRVRVTARRSRRRHRGRKPNVWSFSSRSRLHSDGITVSHHCRRA